MFSRKRKEHYAVIWWPNAGLNPEAAGPYTNRAQAHEARDDIRSQQRREKNMAQVVPMHRGFSR